jgi:hypothetical protein
MRRWRFGAGVLGAGAVGAGVIFWGLEEDRLLKQLRSKSLPLTSTSHPPLTASNTLALQKGMTSLASNNVLVIINGGGVEDELTSKARIVMGRGGKQLFFLD